MVGQRGGWVYLAKVLILSKMHPKGEILGKDPLRIETPWQGAEWLAVTSDRGQLTTSEIYQKVNASNRISQTFRVHKKVIQGSWANAD